MKIGHRPSGFGFRVSGVSSEKARTSLTPDTLTHRRYGTKMGLKCHLYTPRFSSPYLNLCFEKASPRSIMSKNKTWFSIMLQDLNMVFFI